MKPRLDIDDIAKSIHEYYRDLSARKGWVNDFDLDYDELPEFMKEDNRAAARRIDDILALAGLKLEHRQGKLWSPDDQNKIRQRIEQNIELLAEGEHDGWITNRERHGWRYPESKGKKKKKDIDRREHPMLRPFADLSEDEKERDRDSVRNYVEIIALTEFRISD